MQFEFCEHGCHGMTLLSRRVASPARRAVDRVTHAAGFLGSMKRRRVVPASLFGGADTPPPRHPYAAVANLQPAIVRALTAAVVGDSQTFVGWNSTSPVPSRIGRSERWTRCESRLTPTINDGRKPSEITKRQREGSAGAQLVTPIRSTRIDLRGESPH